MKIKVFDSIRDVPKDEWNGLLNKRSCTYSYEFWEAIELSGLNDFRYSHVLVYDDLGSPIGLASFYTVTTDIAIFSSGALKSAIAGIRKAFPNFLKVTMLECGTPITLNRPFVVADERLVGDVAVMLAESLVKLARKKRYFMVIFRDFEPENEAIAPYMQRVGFHMLDSLPTTYMDIAWSTVTSYVDSMQSYYRSKLNKHLRINRQHGMTCELHDDFDQLAGVLCGQWNVVHEHASEYQREMLTPDFYREFSVRLGSRSKVLLFYRDKSLVGHALLLLDGDMLRWLYFGRTEAVNDSLYIFVCYQVIETAIRLGARNVEMGLTTYSIKKDCGAYMSPIRIALRSPWRLINMFVGVVYPLLNHPPAIRNKNIFKRG